MNNNIEKEKVETRSGRRIKNLKTPYIFITSTEVAI